MVKNQRRFIRVATLMALIVMVGLIVTRLQAAWERPELSAPAHVQQDEDEDEEDNESDSTADHSKFEVLQQEFESGPEVTQACLSCHTEAAKQIHQTTHWTWELNLPEMAKPMGKQHVINNFCIGIASNEPRCTSCHVGYGWKDNTFDFTAEENVDCVVCHDTTGTYKKFPTGAGHPTYETKEFGGKTWEPPDLTLIAQNVGPTSRDTCGSCHFFGGGGAGVKHGSLDSSLFSPDKSVEVHMDSDELNFECATCHTAQAHQISGSRTQMSISDEVDFDLPVDDSDRASCVSCHGTTPMKDPKLNEHTDRVACQTCHIPQLARGDLPTKMSWDWSEAGKRNEEGKPIVEKDEAGNTIYDGKKGSFVWERDVTPEYVWFNGIIKSVVLGDEIDDTQVVPLNYMEGSYDDPHSRIFPVKVHRGKQMYDPENKTLVVPHLFGKDEAAYWKSYDWDKAIAAGMEYAGEPYSGKYDWIETEMYWPATHMVAPASEALTCESCHARDGHLAALTDFYLIGRDRIPVLDGLGWLSASLALLGVVVHGSMRFASRKKGRDS